MASCNECSAPLPPSRKIICARCERVARLKRTSDTADQSSQRSVHNSDAESVVPPTTEKTPQSDNTVETNKPSGTPRVNGGSAHSKIKVFHCPDCNMPLVPGDTSCLKCGKKFSKPIPKVADASKIADASQVQTTYRDPILEGTQYHCPQCQDTLEAGSSQCGNCGTQFIHPVPAYKMSYQEAERLKREEEVRRRAEATLRQKEEQERKAQQTEAQSCPQCHARLTPGNYVCGNCGKVMDKPAPEAVSKFNINQPPSQLAKMVIAAVVVCLLLGGIIAATSSSHSDANVPGYAPPTPTVSQAPQPAESQPTQPVSTIEPPSSVSTSQNPQDESQVPETYQGSYDQFDSENESYLEGLASRTGADVSTVKIAAHGILRGYLSPHETSSDRETDFQFTRNGLDILSKYEAQSPGTGVFQLAVDAAQGRDPDAVIKRLNNLRVLNFDFGSTSTNPSDMNNGADLGQVIMGILNARNKGGR